MTHSIADLRAVVRRHVEAEGLRPLAARTGLPIGQIRGICSTRAVRATTIEEVCRALGLELYIGPPRGGADDHLDGRDGHIDTLSSHTRGLVRAVWEMGGDPIPDDLRAALLGRVEEPTTTYDLTDPTALADAGEARRHIEVRELQAAAGGGATTLDETVTGYLAFRRDWLDRHGLDPTQCVVIGVRGESMEPALPEGCSILVDRARRDRRPGRLYVLRTDDGLVVKRLQCVDAEWRLVSEHPDWAPVAWTAETELVGEVRWMARSLP